MKKIFKYIPIFLIAFCLTFGKQIIFANNEEKTLQVERIEYDNKILEYIEKNWMNFFSDDELETYSNYDIIIGEPYGLYSVDDGIIEKVKFPVFVNGKCVLVLNIFENRQQPGELAWTASFTESLLKKIDEIKGKTGKYRYEVKENPNGGPPDGKFVKISETTLRSASNSKYSDIGKALLTFKVDYKKKMEDRSANYPEKKILPMQPKETQGKKPWCAAYAGARILSYEFSQDIRAKDIMEWVHWSWWSKPNLDEKSLSDDDLIRYAKHLGSNPYYVNRSLYRNEIMEEISNYRMIYAGGKNLKTSSLHAMVVYGYEKDKYYYYWNPWGEYGKSIMSSNILSTDNIREYDWIDSIRNFTWK